MPLFSVFYFTLLYFNSNQLGLLYFTSLQLLIIKAVFEAPVYFKCIFEFRALGASVGVRAGEMLTLPYQREIEVCVYSKTWPRPALHVPPAAATPRTVLPRTRAGTQRNTNRTVAPTIPESP